MKEPWVRTAAGDKREVSRVYHCAILIPSGIVAYMRVHLFNQDIRVVIVQKKMGKTKTGQQLEDDYR